MEKFKKFLSKVFFFKFTQQEEKPKEIKKEENNLDPKLEYHKHRIIYLFRIGKIGSFKIDGEDILKYSQVPKDVTNKKFTINKKHVDLFEDRSYVLKHFVPNSDLLIDIKGKLFTLNISHHARLRLLARWAILYYSYEEYRERPEMMFLTKSWKEPFEKELRNKKEIRTWDEFLVNFTNKYREVMDKSIQYLLSRSLRNIKKRKDNLDASSYQDGTFTYVYRWGNSGLVTIKLRESNKVKAIPRDVSVKINGNTTELFKSVCKKLKTEQN